MLPNMLLGRSRALVLVFAGILAGCAIGAATEEDNYDEDGIGGEEPTDAGADVRDGGTGGKGGSKADAADGSGDGGEDDAGLDGGDADGEDDGGDAEPVDPCAPENACADPTDLGTVRGDKGGDTIVVQGTRPQWFKVFVREADEGLLAKKLKVRGTLSSPPGKNFDLYAYRNKGCGGPNGQSNKYSTDDVVTLEWGESGVPNGKDDDEVIHFEVRWATGHVCAEDAPYTLTIRGNP